MQKITPRRDEFAETPEELVADWLAIAVAFKFSRFRYSGSLKRDPADETTLTLFNSGSRLNPLHFFGFALQYAKHCGKPLDQITPREIADAMAAAGEAAYLAEQNRKDAKNA